MVDRKKTDSFDEFEGLVKNVTIEKSDIKSDSRAVTEQYHIEIQALNKEIKGETGLIHTWIRISPLTTATEVTEGSVLDLYLQEMEKLDKAVKKAETHTEAMLWLKDKKCVFKKAKLGRAFKGHDAREYWIPVRML